MPNTGHRDVERHVMFCRMASIYEGKADGVPVHPPDLSTRGMFINTLDQLLVGSVLQLQFRLALTGIQVAVEAEVRHIVEGVGVGVEFVNLSVGAERSIEREIQAAYPDYGSSENRRMQKRSLLSDLPRRMWNTWIHGKEEAGTY